METGKWLSGNLQKVENGGACMRGNESSSACCEPRREVQATQVRLLIGQICEKHSRLGEAPPDGSQ